MKIQLAINEVEYVTGRKDKKYLINTDQVAELVDAKINV